MFDNLTFIKYRVLLDLKKIKFSFPIFLSMKRKIYTSMNFCTPNKRLLILYLKFISWFNTLRILIPTLFCTFMYYVTTYFYDLMLDILN